MRTLIIFLVSVTLAASLSGQTAPDSASKGDSPDAAAGQKDTAGATPPAAADQKDTAGATAPAAAGQKDTAGATAPAAADKTGNAMEKYATGTIDFGYRWVSDIGGDFNTYRSVVNLGSGPKLLGADVSLKDPSAKYFDRFDIHMASWGGDPYNTARVDVRKTGVYALSFDYNNIAYFNFLPSFADPGLSQGKMMTESAYDSARRTSNFEFELLPDKHFSPYIGYTRNSGYGSGVTTFVTQGNEYPVPNSLSDRTNNIRGGVNLNFDKFHLTVEQGGTTFHDDQQVVSTATNFGNVTKPFFGQNLALDSLNERYAISGDSLYTRVYFTGNLASWITVNGSFLYGRPTTTVEYSQQAAGNFVYLPMLAFYNGQIENVTGESKMPRKLGSFSFELRPRKWLRIVESARTDRINNAPYAVIADQLLVSGNPFITSSLTPAQRLVTNYNEQETDAFFDVNSKLNFRAGYRYVWGDTVVPAGFILSDVETEENAYLKRHVGIAGINYHASQKLTLNLTVEASAPEASYFRTSLQDYQRAAVQVRYQAKPYLSFGVRSTILNNENQATGIGYSYYDLQNSVSVMWTPSGGKRVSLLAEYTNSRIRSDVSYFAPSTLTPEMSYYRDYAHTGTSLLSFALPFHSRVEPRLSVGGSFFVSSGSRPTTYYQPVGKLSVPLGRRAEWNSEWRWYSLSQAFYLYEGFRTHQVTTGFRLIL